MRAFAGKPIVGWIADNSLPRIGKLLIDPRTGQVFAVDGDSHQIIPLGTASGIDVAGPAGTYVFDGAWHPRHGITFAFGSTNGRGPWVTAHVRADGSVADIGVPVGLPVISLCSIGKDDFILGVASTESSGGKQIGGGIARFSPNTRDITWLYRPPAGEHFVPSGVAVDSEAILFALTSKHVVMRLTLPGSLECVIGRYGIPDSDSSGLNSPIGIDVGGGVYLVTDRGNRRVLKLDRTGRVIAIAGELRWGQQLIDPHDAFFCDGRVLIADLGTRTVLEMSADLETTIKRWGGPEASGLVLSRPRSIDRAPTGELIIADTNNHRILGVDERGSVNWEIRQLTGADGSRSELKWPRSARMSRSGRLVVADSLNRRFLVLDRNGSIECQIDRIRAHTIDFDVSDPHDARWIGDDELLLVDSAAGWVARARTTGLAVWVLAGLSDPHQADIFGQWIIVADPELDAVLLVDATTGMEVWRRNEFIDARGRICHMFKPRVVRAAPDFVIVVDADCQIMCLGHDWLVLWAWHPAGARRHQHELGFAVPDAPRDIVVESEDRILVSDYRRNCILELTTCA